MSNTILIIGNYDTFTKQIIKKLRTEKWRIYTLVNNKIQNKPKHVFEEYVFDYKSETVKEVIESCRPDTVLFTGPYDTSYNWNPKIAHDTALNFIADISNILITVSALSTKHFVYISSETVFENDYITDINEDMVVSPSTYKGTAIALGEKITLYFGHTTQTETTVVRIANMCKFPSNREYDNDPVSRMCLSAVINGRLQVNAKREFSSIYINDAVDALSLLINANERKYNLYHVSSAHRVTEDKIAKIIKDTYNHPIDIVDKTTGLRKRMVLSNERFCKEFSFDVKNRYEEFIPRVIAYIDSHKKHFLNNDEKSNKEQDRHRIKRLFGKIVPFLECILLFVPVFVLNHGFIKIKYISDINYYLLFVLLFSVVYGSQQAIFSSLLCVVGHLLSRLLNPTNISLYLDTDLYIQVAQVFIVGLSVGYLKDRYTDQNKQLNDEIDFLKEKLEEIKIINSSNKKIKDYYTDKIISSRESIGRIYEITSKINKAEKGETLFVAIDILKEIMETQDVSIYLVSNKDFCRLVSSTGPRAGSLGKSIRMNDYSMIFDVLKTRQVYINRDLDNSLPMMASALFDDNQYMRIVIFLWDIPYEQMTLYSANLLTIVGALIYSAFVQGANYLDALAYRRYIEGTTILREDAFNEMVDIFKRAKEKGYTESCIIYIQNDGMTIYEINEKISSMLRDTDYIGLRHDGTIAVLLTNTGESESSYVMERLRKADIKAYLGHSI